LRGNKDGKKRVKLNKIQGFIVALWGLS